jgi:hypothetical protein
MGAPAGVTPFTGPAPKGVTPFKGAAPPGVTPFEQHDTPAAAVTPGLKPQYETQLEADAAKQGIPVPLARTVQAIEDAAGDPGAVSSAGAVGLMQTMPDTFRHYEPHASLTDPSAQLDAGTRYLADLWHEYNGNTNEVLANYNGGPGAVEYLRKHGTMKGYSVTAGEPLGETYDYLRKANATMAKMQVEADEHAAAVLLAHRKALAAAQGAAAGERLAHPRLAGMGEPALEPLLRLIGHAAEPLAGPVQRVVGDYQAAGFGRAAGIEGATGLVPLQSEAVRFLAKINPQLASELANQSGINPAKLGLSLPAPQQPQSPVTQFGNYVQALAAIPREKAFSAAMFLGNVADAAWWVPINASMRDMAMEQIHGGGSAGANNLLPSPGGPVIGPETQHVRDELFKALKNPMQAGQILDNLNHDYGFMRHADLVWWQGNPEIRQYIANAKPTTPMGVVAQRAIALHANLADAYIKAPLTTGVVTFAGEFFNPFLVFATPERVAETAGLAVRGVNSVARMGLNSKAVKAAASLGGRAADRFVTSAEAGTMGAGKAAASFDRMRTAARSAVRQGLRSASTFMREQAPLTSTPYSATMGDTYGFEGIVRSMNAEHELGGIPEVTRERLNNPAYFGGTSPEVASLMHQQHDTFFNAQRTLYTKSPGGAAPAFDPITGKMSVRLGVVPDLQNAGDYAYATFNPWQEGTQHFETTAQNAYESAVLTHTIGVTDAATVRGLLDKGSIGEAFTKAGVQPEYDDFAQQMGSLFASNPPKDARAAAALTRTAAGERIATALAKKEGWKRVWVKAAGNDQVHFVDNAAMPDTWHQPDMTPVNGVPVFVRTRNATQAIRDFDDAIRARDPLETITPRFIEASWSRSGMWLGEDGKAMDNELAAVSKAGYSANPGEGPSRSFASIAEAKAHGLQVNPEFDPRISLERQLSRAQRYVTLSDWLRDQHLWTKKGGEIDYDATYKAMKKAGVLDEGDPPVPDDGFGKGPLGVANFRAWLNQVATSRAQRAAVGSVLPDAEMQARIGQEAGKLSQSAKQAYSNLRPGIAFDADGRLDLGGVAGYGIPEDVMTAIMQADPVYARMFLNRQPIRDTFEARVPDQEDLLRGSDHDQLATRMVSGFSALMRLGLLADPTYHPLVNLATQLFVKSGRADDAFTAFFMPHTIPDADYERMQQFVGRSMRGTTAPGTSSERVAEAMYARQPIERGKNPWKILNPMSLGQRAKIMATALKDIPIGHQLQAVITYLDDAQQALVFSVWEDAFKTLLFKRLEAKYGDPWKAALETKKTLTGTGMLTAFEKRLGLNRIVWFYAWGKAMTQFWLDQLYRSPRNIAAPMEAIRTQNENVAPGSEAGKPGSFQRRFGLGGPRENRIAFRWGGKTYLTPTISTPNFIWGGEVADAINVLAPERPIKWVDNFAMNRLSGGYRILADTLKSATSGAKQPAPGTLYDLADPNTAHALFQGFANVAGNFRPMAGPLTGPIEAVIGAAAGGGIGASGAERVIPATLKRNAFYADQAVRAAITGGTFPYKTRERLFSIVQDYEADPTNPKKAGRLVTVAQALHDLTK